MFNLNYQKIPFFYQTGTLRYLLPVALEEDDIGEFPAPANDGHILEHLLHVDPTVAQQLAPVTHHPPVQPVLAHTTFDKIDILYMLPIPIKNKISNLRYLTNSFN